MTIIKSSNDRIMLEGKLDENTDADELARLFLEFEEHDCHQVNLDMGKLLNANSLGTVKLLRAVEKLSKPIVYLNVPIWMVDQMNIIPDFLNGNFFVKNVECPFFCMDDDSNTTLILEIGTDIPLMENTEDLEIDPIEIDGKTYEVDIDPADYFSFISILYKRQK